MVTAIHHFAAAGLLAMGGLLAATVGAAATGDKTCCEQKLACCGQNKACCQAPAKLGCCQPGTACCQADKACCANTPACCIEGKDCCHEAKACCGHQAPQKTATRACCSAKAGNQENVAPADSR